MAQHETEVTIKGIAFEVGFWWVPESPDEWDYSYARPVGDDADFLGWFQDDSRAMEIMDREIERWANERLGTRYGDPMDLARERTLEESA